MGINAYEEIHLQQMEQINQIIFDLYDYNRPFHSRISDFFQSALSLFYFDKASLMFFYKDETGQYRKQSSITFNWDIALLDKYDKGLYAFDDTLAPVDVPYPVMLKSSSFFHEKERNRTPFWQQYMAPSNADFEIFGNILLGKSTNAMRCKLCFARNTDAGDFSLWDLQIIRLFQPHLSRITTRYQNRIQREQADALENYNCIGHCVINHQNQLTQSTSTFIKIDQKTSGRLSGKVLQLCRNMDHSECNAGILSCEYKFDDEPIFLEISCTEATAHREYHCMVYDLSHFFNSTLKQARTAYQLTDREYEILSYILQGLKNEDIAGKLFLSVPSIKKYIASIFSKMNVTNQKQIFQKLNFF